MIFTNNSAVNLNDIGEGERALLCKTNLISCCRTLPNRFGEFFYPSGDQVPIRSRGEVSIATEENIGFVSTEDQESHLPLAGFAVGDSR